MRKIIRLTESDIRNMVRSSLKRILKEDVLGNDFNVNQDVENSNDNEYNNYEFLKSQEDYKKEDEFRNNFKEDEFRNNWSTQGEKLSDPSQYDPIEENPEYYWPEDSELSDGQIERGNGNF